MNRKGNVEAILKGGVPLALVLFGAYLWVSGNWFAGLFFIILGAVLFALFGRS